MPADGLDVVHANRRVVLEMQREAIPVERARQQLMASTFVYDYTHPSMRTARNLVVSVETGKVASPLTRTVGGRRLSQVELEVGGPAAPAVVVVADVPLTVTFRRTCTDLRPPG